MRWSHLTNTIFISPSLFLSLSTVQFHGNDISPLQPPPRSTLISDLIRRGPKTPDSEVVAPQQQSSKRKVFESPWSSSEFGAQFDQNPSPFRHVQGTMNLPRWWRPWSGSFPPLVHQKTHQKKWCGGPMAFVGHFSLLSRYPDSKLVHINSSIWELWFDIYIYIVPMFGSIYKKLFFETNFQKMLV